MADYCKTGAFETQTQKSGPDFRNPTYVILCGFKIVLKLSSYKSRSQYYLFCVLKVHTNLKFFFSLPLIFFTTAIK